MKNNDDYNFLRKKVLWLVLLILAVGGSLLTVGCGAEEAKTYKIAFFTEDPVRNNIVEGFKAGMTDLGYIEGKNISYLAMTYADPDIKEHFSKIKPDFSNWEAVNREFVQKRILDEQVDLVVTADGPTTNIVLMGSEEAKLPIVFTYGTGIEGWAYVESFAHPGGRVTGIASGIDEATSKRMEILKKMAPDIKKVLWVYWPGGTVFTSTIELHRETAKSLGLELVEKPMLPGGDLVPALFESVQPGEVDAIFAEVGTSYQAPKELAALIERDKLPCIYPTELPGALAVYDVDGYKSGFQAARKADSILRGADPGSLPIEFPNKIELTIDLRAAEKIGLTIPAEVLLTADKVIPAQSSN